MKKLNTRLEVKKVLAPKAKKYKKISEKEREDFFANNDFKNVLVKEFYNKEIKKAKLK